MDRVRRIDWWIQAVIGAFCVITAFTITFALMGEFILGVWQLISAALNTWPMLRSPYRKQIIIYWMLVAISLSLLISGSDILITISTIGSFGIALYYWRIYKLFIDHIAYRKELGTLIRH